MAFHRRATSGPLLDIYFLDIYWEGRTTKYNYRTDLEYHSNCERFMLPLTPSFSLHLYPCTMFVSMGRITPANAMGRISRPF